MLAAAVLCLSCITAAAPQSSVVEELRRAKNEYAYGNYAEAAERLRSLLYPMRLVSDDQVIEARKYLALSYYLLDRLDEVGEEFAKLLYLDPDYDLDPFTVAPPVIETFETVRKQLQPELDVIRQRRSDAQLGEQQLRGIRRTITTKITEHSELGTILPFGVGQFQNGQMGWGLIFAGTELALASANIGAYLTARRHSVYDEKDSDARRLVQQLTVVQYASAAMLGLVWSLGVFHARLHFVPSVVAPPLVHDEPVATSARRLPTLGLTGRF